MLTHSPIVCTLSVIVVLVSEGNEHQDEGEDSHQAGEGEELRILNRRRQDVKSLVYQASPVVSQRPRISR